MKLTREDQLAAEAGGCQFRSATESQVQRLTMQQRIFWIEGRPHVAMRHDGFMETAGTLRRLLQDAAARRPVAPAAAPAPAAPPQAPPASTPQEPVPSASAPQASAPPAPFPSAPRPAATVPAAPPPVAEAPSVAAPRPVAPAPQAVPAVRKAPAAPATAAEESPPAPVRKRTRSTLTARPRSTDPLVLAAHIATARMAGPEAEGTQLPALMASVHETLARLTPPAAPDAPAPRRTRAPAAGTDARPRPPVRRRPTE